MRSTIVIATVLLLCALPLAAHEPKMSEEQKKMMEAMERAGTPGPPHKMLDGMVGSWDVEVKYWPAPGAPPMVSKATADTEWLFGGRYVEERFKGEMMGAPFEGRGITGYDNIKKHYFATWMDSMSTAIMMMTGHAADGGKVWNFKGTMDDPLTGKALPISAKTTVAAPDKLTFEMWNQGPDGKPYRAMEMTYTRRK